MSHDSNLLRDTTAYVLLLALLFMTAAIAIVMIPIIVALQGYSYYFIAILGLVFGLLIDHYVIHLGNFEKKHHASIWLIVILGSLMNFFVLYLTIPINLGEYAFKAATLFAFCFLVPNIITIIFHKHKKENKLKHHKTKIAKTKPKKTKTAKKTVKNKKKSRKKTKK